jgi:extracellular elastinolytic metalloproteinase
MKKHILVVLLFNCFYGFSQNVESIIKSYFTNLSKSNFTAQDINEINIISNTNIGGTNTKVYYVNQVYNGIPIENASASITIKDQNVIDASNNFVVNTSKKIKYTASSKSSISISNVVHKALILKNYADTKITTIEKIASNQYKTTVVSQTDKPIFIDLVYTKQTDGFYELTYNVELFDEKSNNLYLIKLRASDLHVLSQKLLTLSCSNSNHKHDSDFIENSFNPILFKTKQLDQAIFSDENSSYLVYDFFSSGPLQGNRILESSPYDLIASPFGWHDVDGKFGAEYTITRGNNVFAYEDRKSENKPGYSPNGGNNLQFIYPYNGPQTNSDTYLDASITNLFYVNNKLHDLFYKFGFDENSGNFQQNQYGRISSSYLNGSDALIAEAQDGSGENNANISVPRDGSSPRMQMYLWKPQLAENIYVTSPNSLIGYFSSTESAFEPGYVALPSVSTPIQAKIVLLENIEPGNFGCIEVINVNELQGNIALIVRGTCSFTEKVLKAQQAGAIAVIVMNNVADDAMVRMSGEGYGITIPALFVTKETGDKWLEQINIGIDVFLRLGKAEDTRILDASFDNGIITHEFTHGVTIRLTGGRGVINCLNSTEQMGEGWSDYFSLLLQIKPGDVGTTPIGVGAFITGKNDLSASIRQYPYSTDLSINPLTYGDTNSFFTVEDGVTKINSHRVGTVWASILWDLTWKLIDNYGFDPNFSNPNSGNYKAFNIIMNAIKLQSCNPSFITARNAILKADEILYNNEHACLIWKSFANRGVGLNASAGFDTEANDIKDQVEDFTMPSLCDKPESLIPINPLVKIYPNPTQNDLVINIPQYTAQLEVLIFDIHGRLIVKEVLNNFSVVSRLKLNTLNKGMYFIHVKGENINYQTKLIKN